MKKKLLDILEKHIDKLILGVIGILSLAILWMFVIGSPYAVKYGSGKAGPGQIDKQIKTKAERLDSILKGKATEDPKKYSGNHAAEYVRTLAAIDINENIFIPMPGAGAVVLEDRSYKKPSIPPVTDVDVEVIRTAYFVPTEKIDSTVTYKDVQKEVGDLDLVSVQASLDVTSLYKSFQNCFDGRTVPADFRDETLAVPIFAAVQLQRQKKLENGQWTLWQTVERTKIDHRKEIFQVPQKIENVELGGIDLLVMNFGELEIQQDLLQPAPYDVAASNAEWLPPTLHKELSELIEKEESIKARESRNKGRSGSGLSMYGESDRRYSGRLRTNRPQEQVRTSDIIREDYQYMMLSDIVDLSTLSDELLTVWAHDDTVVPSNTYRYRIRVGLFNPTAGKGWFKGADAAFRDDVILWTEYSDTTEDVALARMMHFFPLKVARDNDKLASIQVSKFYQGKWQSHEFEVAVGDTIGEEITIEPEARESGSFYNRRRAAEELEKIDFTSDAVFVDIVESGQSSLGGYSSKAYQEILFTRDGETIEHLGLGKRSWSKDLLAAFNRVAEDEDLVFTLTGSSRSSIGVRGGGESGYDDEDDFFDEDFF